MKRYCLFLAMALCLVPAGLTAQTNTDSITRRLDDYLVSASGLYAFNGSALVAQRGKVLLQKGYGYKDAASGSLNDSNSVFQICSITKMFTAVVVMKLQEEGRLSVHDKLGRYFPGFPQAATITLENLLTHTSGIYNYTNDIDEGDSAIICHPVQRQQFLDIIYPKPLAFTPGTKFSYNNSGYYLLGMIIEKVTGKPYEQVVREMIFTPLHMEHSGFDFRGLQDTAKATAYKTLTATRQARAILWDSTVTYSAGSIYSTSGDMYKWARAIAGKQLLSEASWQQVFTPRLAKYGYGCWIDSAYGKKYIMHSGGLPGFMSYLCYYPDEDVTIILLNNSGDYGQSLVSVNLALSGIIFKNAHTILEKKTVIQQDASLLKKWVGVYAINKEHSLIITQKHGQLYIEASNPADMLPRLPFLQEGENSFFIKEVLNSAFEFATDEANNSIKLVAHFNETETVWKKVK